MTINQGTLRSDSNKQPASSFMRCHNKVMGYLPDGEIYLTQDGSDLQRTTKTCKEAPRNATACGHEHNLVPKRERTFIWLFWLWCSNTNSVVVNLDNLA